MDLEPASDSTDGTRFRLRVPERFAADTIAREGEDGRAWIRALPGELEALIRRWRLTPDGPAVHGYVGIVLPVLQGRRKCVLKLSWIDEDSLHEADALEAWNGHGAVRLYDADRSRGALLLERLDADTTLESLPPDEAIEVAGRLLRRLAIPAPSWARRLEVVAADLRASLERRWQGCRRPFERGVLDRAARLLEDLGPRSGGLLIDTDLHYRNVLAGERSPWLAIDPKVLAGDPEFGAAQLLWQEFAGIRGARDLDRRLEVLCTAADLDASRACGWSYVRIVDYWLWAVEQGLTEDPARCERLIGLLESVC